MFRRSLSALGGRRRGPSGLGGRNILVPPKPVYPLRGQPLTPLGRPIRPRRSSAAERRRRNLTYLATFIIVTFVLGILPPLRFLLVLNLIADVLLVLYLGLAAYMAAWPPPRERTQTPQPDPALAPERAANGF